jgi:uncharacterized protein (DUF111 family)
VIAPPERADEIAHHLLRETTTLGVRLRREERIEADRRFTEVATPHGAVTLKVARLPDGSERAVPEFESLRRTAEASGKPLREVAEAAIASWRKEQRLS